MNSEGVIKRIGCYLGEVGDTLTALPVTEIARVVGLLDQARQRGASIFLFGNGGSAATASHMTSDLAKGAICKDKPRLKAHALVDNLPLFSAWANDSDYADVFSEQLENFAQAGDMAIGISGSGNSANIINGIIKANEKGLTTIGLLGFDGGKLKALVDLAVVVPCHCMEQVEDIHLLIGHVVSTCLREQT